MDGLMNDVLITGGAGYIGSHTCLELLEAGYKVTVIDNLSNSRYQALQRVEALTGKAIDFHQVDIRDRLALESVFSLKKFNAVVHFAGLKAVGESVENPLSYYENNVAGSCCLFEVMLEAGCNKLVFSSSATVYGGEASVPIFEHAPLTAVNPYGRTKLFIEEIIRDVAHSSPGFGAAILRYFNPVGAHASGRIGEDPKAIPNNLMPYVSQVAVGRLEKLSVFGGDYPTVDGTGVRDYIHVVDLAKGHVAALQRLDAVETSGVDSYNLGTGKGYSVLELVRAFESAAGKKIPYEIVERRPGDSAICYADTTKAKEVLGWTAQMGLDEMVESSWRWQSRNPNGYDDAS